MSRPLETKVAAGAGGAGAGAIVAQFVDYLIGATVYHGGSVPEAVAGFVTLACSAGLAYAAGYFAPHTPTDNPANPAG